MTRQNQLLQKDKASYQKQLAECERVIEGLKEELAKVQSELGRQTLLIDNLNGATFNKVCYL